jgi:hypothetical protein
VNDEVKANEPGMPAGAKVLEAATKPENRKPPTVSEREWRRARMEAGHMVVIRSHFKSIFLIPLALISLVCGIAVVMGGDPENPHDNWVHFWGLLWAFSFIFYMNIFIFEWNRAWTLVLMGSIVSLVCLGFAVNSEQFPVWKNLYGWFRDLELGMSQQAYFFFAIFFGLCALVSWIKTRLNYVVIEHNEMQIYRNAFFGDRERRGMMSPRVEVKVTDMIEYFHPFYRAGTVVIHHGQGQGDSILLDNVLNIRKIERITDRLGSVLRVAVENDQGH